MPTPNPWLAAAVCTALAVCPEASAGSLNRAYVSAARGVLGNPCTQALPCRTINEAVPTVTSGGEVLILDSGGYGQLLNGTLASITQPVTIVVPPGVFGALSVPATGATSALSINAPGATVTLRGLTITSQGSSATQLYGVEILAADQVNIENCVISNFNSVGQVAVGTAVNATTGTHPLVALNVTDSTFRNNVTSVSLGAPPPSGTTPRTLAVANTDILYDTFAPTPSSGQAVPLAIGIQVADLTDATVSNSRLIGLSSAIQGFSTVSSAAPINFTIDHNLISGNQSTGVFLAGLTGSGFNGTINATLTGNSITGNPNAIGVLVNGQGAISLSGNRIVDNFWGIEVNPPATATTYGDNILGSNRTDVSGTLTAVSGQ